MSYKSSIEWNLTPEEAWLGCKPSVAHIRVFGCTSYAHVPKEKRRKLDDKSLKCIFIGYSTKTKSYKLFDHEAKQIIISRDAFFNKQGFYQPKYVQIESSKKGVEIGNGSFFKTKDYKKPKQLTKGQFERDMLYRKIEKRITRSQSSIVNFALMPKVVKTHNLDNYAEA